MRRRVQKYFFKGWSSRSDPIDYLEDDDYSLPFLLP